MKIEAHIRYEYRNDIGKKDTLPFLISTKEYLIPLSFMLRVKIEY